MSSNNNNNNNDIIKIVYELPKKKGGQGQGEIVNRVIDRLNTCFNEIIIPNNNINSSETSSSTKKSFSPRYLLLTIQILQCTEGSRWGRICCSEVGVGWVVLELQWKLTDTTITTTTTTTLLLETTDEEAPSPSPPPPSLLTEGTKKLRDSGAIGFADFYHNDVGEVALLDKMTPKLAIEIANECIKNLSIKAN